MPNCDKRLYCPWCGNILWSYPDGRETCSRCEYDQKPGEAPAPLRLPEQKTIN